MPGELFIKSNGGRDLETFGPHLFGILDATIIETRHSDNRWGGRYLVGRVCGLRLELERADDALFASYDFRLAFEPWVNEYRSGSDQLGEFADVVAKYLAKEGLSVARPLSDRADDCRFVEYKPARASK